LSLAVPAAWAASPGVLIIHSNQRPTPAAIVIEDSLRNVVPVGFGRPVEIFSEYLDVEWPATPAYQAEAVTFLGHKYEGRNLRVIVSSAPQAFRFATELRDGAFPGVPIVHIAFPTDQLEQLAPEANVAGRTIDLDPTPTLRLAMRLQPQAKRLVVVLGAAERDRIWERRVRTAVAGLGDGLEVEYLSGLPTAEVLRRVATLPAASIVYTPGYFSDGTGAVTVPRETVERIARASAAPVYGPLDTFVGTGAVGGSVTPYEDQAKEAGAIVVRLLNGATAAGIGNASVHQVPMVDWRQLSRWRLDPALLPSDTIVKFKEATVWDRYWREIGVAVALLLLQAALIAALLFERRTRRSATVALEDRQEQLNLAARAAGLSSWVWDTARDAPHARGVDQVRQPPIPFDRVVESVHAADRDNLRRAVGRAQRTGEDLDIEYRVVSRDGGVRWIAARGRAEAQQPNRLLGVALDVTERKATELRAFEDRAALRHMTRVSTMGQLSAAIAHQLNQPLAAILGNAETAQKLLARDKVDVAELRAICSDIVDEDRRASEIIHRLNDLYRRSDMQTERLDLNALSRETLDLMHSELLIRHVTPVTEFATALPAVDGGHVQMQQVLLNLILNAAEAMSGTDGAARVLTLRTETRDSEVSVLVMDNGPGISPQHLKSVFDPFWSTKADGMGMGLAICRSIVLAHGGKISAANRPGGGASFGVSLPARQAAAS
jgi:C4-dicarboxylate-specific signal transduction histidine kinase